jgi:putative protease
MERMRACGMDGLRLGDPGLAELAWPDWRGRIYLDFSLNAMNLATLRFLLTRAVRAALSPELNLARCQALSDACPGGTEILAHGRLEMMIAAHCLTGALLGGKNGPGHACGRPCAQGPLALRDRMGMFFPVVPDRFCRTHVLNSLDLSLLPVLDKVARDGCDLRLELHGRGGRYASVVTGAYRQGLAALAAGTWTRSRGEEAEAALAGFSPAGFTRGHFFRGVE